MRRTASTLRTVALALLILASFVGCTSAPAATQSPTLSPTATPTATSQPTPGTESPLASASPASSPANLGAELRQAGELTICSAFPRSRFAERDAAGDPFGVDVEIGQAIAEQLALEPVISELPFEELIDAVVDGRCDVAISGHFITQERLQLIDLIPYREGRVSPVVVIGNPLGIDSLTDLCGRTAAIVEGTIYHDLVRGVGEYADEGLDQQCDQAYEAAVVLAEYATEDDAVASLSAGDSDAFIGNEAIAADRPGEFELSAAELPRLRNGIGHRHGLDLLDGSLRSALRALIGDGSYAAILERYGTEGAALTELP